MHAAARAVWRSIAAQIVGARSADVTDDVSAVSSTANAPGWCEQQLRASGAAEQIPASVSFRNNGGAFDTPRKASVGKERGARAGRTCEGKLGKRQLVLSLSQASAAREKTAGLRTASQRDH